jgi:hypothetical protein
MAVVNLQALEEKFQLLLKKLYHLQEENQLQKETIKRQQIEIEEQQSSLTALEDKVKMLKIAASADGGGMREGRKELRSTINSYIRELDRCIARLNE